MDYQLTPEGKDPQLWHLAHKRVSFKNHLAVYIVVNLFFWMLWYLTGAKIHNDEGVPWPVWPMIGWGIGIIFHFIAAYVNTGDTLIEKEYQKLKNQNH